MHVLLLCDDLYLRGAPKHVVELSGGLVQRGHSVIVCASDGPLRSKLDRAVKFVRLPIVYEGSFRKRFAAIPATLVGLRGTIREHCIDIIHSHKRYSDALAQTVAKFSGVPHVSTCHNTFSNYRRITRFGDMTIACCEHVRKMLVEDFHKIPESVKTVYIGMRPLNVQSTDTLDGVRRDLGLGPNVRVLASVGSLTPAKDRMTLLLSLKEAQAAMRASNAVCLIVGEGPESAILKSFIAASRLEELVRLLPANTNIPVVMSIAEFLVLSSVQEGLPYVLLEAASLCKPHIATDVGGVSEFVIDGDTGLLIPPKSPERLASAIQDLLGNPLRNKMLGAKARQKFEQQHDFQHFIDETVKVYEEVLNNSGSHLRTHGKMSA